MVNLTGTRPPPTPPPPPPPPFGPIISRFPRYFIRRTSRNQPERIAIPRSLQPPPTPPPPPPPTQYGPSLPLKYSILRKKRKNNPPPPPPPTPPIPFGPNLPLKHFILRRRRKNKPPPTPPPPPPTPFGPNLPLKYLILTRIRRNHPPASLNFKNMFTWYLLTLMMRQKLETRDQEPDETRKEWVISIKDKMEQVLRLDVTTSWDKVCIYRVPHSLKENDNKSYSPQTVSLGPYHHGNKQLLPMDHHKWRAVNMVLKHTEQDIEIYIDAMKELEARARACYEGPINMDSNMFTQMMVFDGCFVLELLRGAYEGFSKLGYDRNDPVFAMRGLTHSIRRDMLMLENQLPLFVLNRLLELQLGTRNQTGLVAQLAARFFNPLMPTYMPSTKIEISQENNKFFNPIADKDKEELHCLDVFRRTVLQPSLEPEPRLSRTRWFGKPLVADKHKQNLVHCVTELREAGVKFKRRKTDRFWDIKFKNGCLEIPKILIHDGTKSLFSNLIAYEQCHIDSNNDITSYIIFMDNLIDSAEDVRYLHYYGIIEHWLGTDSEVADVFNQLCQEVAFDLDGTYLSKLSNKVDRYYNRRWNVLKATLKHKYFNNPWAYFSFFAAVTLLLLTLFQSFFTSYPYFKPPS
ncbi:hypothetical protein V5N11_006380 [Cardamine amara subsp. amara]|uniref:Uncharacterized protein n=1 Tax=Cardamine amara subsp. amara TaxID=228776 RepID=A0ABD1BIQ9_CARAN